MIQGAPDKKQSTHAGMPHERPWTAVEKYRLRGMISQGFSPSKIARSLGRPLASVVGMASNFGLMSND